MERLRKLQRKEGIGMKSLLSVIVPAYNREKEIGRCLDSILGQTYSNLEIIVVDDGSADDTAAVCAAYAKKDNRIRIIHKENAGAIAARRTGVENAQGEVVTFVDSDDFIEPAMYESMMAIYDKYEPDVITSGYYVNGGRDEIYHDLIAEGYYDKEQIRSRIVPRMMFDFKAGTQGIMPSLCNKLFNKIKVLKCIQNIDPRVSLGDDAAVVYQVIAQADSMYIMKNSWYHYINNRNSMCHACEAEVFGRIAVVQKEFERIFVELNMLREMKSQMERYVSCLIEIAVNGVYGVSMKNVTYVFPFDKVPKGSKVVLYGAGVVGNSYWQCLRDGKYAEVVAWVDRNYAKIECVNGVTIEEPLKICETECDYVVIAIKNEVRASEIKEWLLRQGICSEKIIWTE